MKHYLTLLREYFLRYARLRLHDRRDFVISVLKTLVSTALALGVVLVLFDRPRLAEWTFHEILFLYGFSLIPFSLFNVVGANLYGLAEGHLAGGTFDGILLRPADSLFQVLVERFRLESPADTVIGLVLMLYAAGELRLAIGFFNWIFLFFAVLCTLLIYLAVFVVIACVSFWTRRRGAGAPVVRLLGNFGGWTPFVLRWMIPFGFAMWHPRARLWRDFEYQPLLLLLTMTTLLVVLALSFWQRGVAHYSRAGS